MNDNLIIPDWPAPPHVHAAVVTQRGAGSSIDRASLRETLALPSEPRWLRQVHGTRVIAFDRPHPSPPPRAGEGDERAARKRNFLPPLAGVRGGAFELPGAVRADSNARDRMSRAGLSDERTTRESDNGARRADGGNAATKPAEPQADAAVTCTPGVVLAIKTADCLPVLFCADDGSGIAAAHAGWRGLSASVLENTLAAMQAPRENILAWLGPAIAAPSYEVGQEVRDAFLAHDPAAASAFAATRPEHWSCDLYALARQRLQRAGITRIFGGGLDTFTDPGLHSYRRDGARSGRMVSLVWLA